MGDLEGRWQIDGRTIGDTMAKGVSGAADADYGEAYTTHLEITKDDGPAVVGPATNHLTLRMLDALPTDYLGRRQIHASTGSLDMLGGVATAATPTWASSAQSGPISGPTQHASGPTQHATSAVNA